MGRLLLTGKTWRVGSSIRKHRQIELAKASGVCDRVDVDDPAALDRNTEHHKRIREEVANLNCPASS